MKETKESDSDHYSSDDDHYSDDFENSPKKSPTKDTSTKDTSTKDTSTIDTSEAKEKEQDPGPEQKQEEQEETKDFTKEDPLPPSSGDWKEIPFDSIEIEEQIGGGGVGLVHRGYYQDREVAVKTLFDPKVNEALKVRNCEERSDELEMC